MKESSSTLSHTAIAVRQLVIALQNHLGHEIDDDDDHAAAADDDDDGENMLSATQLSLSASW